LAGLAALLSFAPAAGLAQSAPRSFPADARVGLLQVDVFPSAVLNGQKIVMAPGARIYDTANRIIIPSTLGSAVQVLYKLDALGQVHHAWILTPRELELARHRGGR
ncbi:MAG: hypothetical protein VW339_08720, partial [Quisquiliibacterium sp.]